MPLLIQILRRPEVAVSLEESSWGLLIRQARAANVLGRVLSAIDGFFPCADWPSRPQQVFLAERHLADHRQASLRWEMEGLARDLAKINVRPIALKGAAYLLQKYEFAFYRQFGDIDILVPREKLADVEVQLTSRGWLGTKPGAYDQEYYRRWMHELPPMQHLHRGTSLDVHHAILPLTGRYKPETSLLLGSSRAAFGMALVDVLHPFDMFLHAAAHLFCEGEHQNSLRNLLDLYDLLHVIDSNGTSTPGQLVDRGIALNLTPVLALATRQLWRIFGLDVAQKITLEIQQRGLVYPALRWSDWMFDGVFLGFHPSHKITMTNFARHVLYLRGHALRMPPGLLTVHLVRKAWSARRER